MADIVLATIFLIGGIGWTWLMLEMVFSHPTGTFFPLISILAGAVAALTGFGWWVAILWSLIV